MIFLDTSALMKRYVVEPASEPVDHLMMEDPLWAASALAQAETSVSLCHRGVEGAPSGEARDQFDSDWQRFIVVPVDAVCLASAMRIGCEHRIRTLAAIHLAAAQLLPGNVTFVTFDVRQLDAARSLGLEVAQI